MADAEVMLRAPNGKYIVGLLEELRGCALTNFFEVRPDGSLEPEYVGETDVWWDTQEPVRRRGGRVYLDEGYRAWREADLVRVPMEEYERDPEEEQAP